VTFNKHYEELSAVVRGLILASIMLALIVRPLY